MCTEGNNPKPEVEKLKLVFSISGGLPGSNGLPLLVVCCFHPSSDMFALISTAQCEDSNMKPKSSNKLTKNNVNKPYCLLIWHTP